MRVLPGDGCNVTAAWHLSPVLDEYAPAGGAKPRLVSTRRDC
jgi:hypothetical protein